jgi:hypothetical protein
MTSGWDRPGNEVVIGHATSPDLISWRMEDSAIGVGPPGSLDAAHVYAPSVIEWNGLYYMIYTGNQFGFSEGEHLFLATSPDLYHWTRYQSEPIFAPDRAWAIYEADAPLSGRDPHLFHHERYGFILYYVARLRGDSITPNGTYSCVAAATSPDLVHWTDRGPLVIRKTFAKDQAFAWNHPESPCLIRRGEEYFLFWKGGEGTRYVRGNDPLDFTGAEEHRLATSHASEIFDWEEKWFVTSCSRRVDDVAHARSDRTKGLFLAGIEWEGGLPRIATLEHVLRVCETTGPIEEKSVRPNPARRGQSIFVRVEKNGSGEHDLSVTDIRSIPLLQTRIASVVDPDGTRSVEIPTGDLPPGIYFLRVDRTMARVIIY